MASADLFGFLLVFCLSLHGLEGADVWTVEGDSPVLPCRITYDPNVNLFWTLQPVNINIVLKHPDGRVEVPEKPFKGRVEFVDGKRLRIRNVSRLDDSSVWGGEYQCSQGSRTGERSHLHVRHPPSRVAITGYNSSSTLHPGDELQLTCNASDSNPEPSYSWFKNGQKISSDSTLTFDPIKLENNGDIIICKVNLRDANRPVFEWEGESERIALSVTVDEPGDDTTVDGPGNGVNVGLAVGLSVPALVGLAAIIPIVYVIVKKFRDTDRPTTGTVR
ncbi:cell adhesion molecule 2-like [Branchiostoma floridae x Branchiostoma belcheri]